MAAWFGFKAVTDEEKPGLVNDVFRRVAGQYDLMNDLMSLGVHRLWKHEFIKAVAAQPGQRILDMAGGTGDIALGILRPFRRQAQRPHITIADINPEMIRHGRARALNEGWAGNPDWVVADAAKLPFADHMFDTYTIAFGLRNVTQIDAALAEARRVLKPGGRFYCLEFSKLANPVLQKGYDLYTLGWLPKLGQLIAKDAAAYQYLAESIAKFDTQEQLIQRLTKVGFRMPTYRNLSAGIVAIHQGVA